MRFLKQEIVPRVHASLANKHDPTSEKNADFCCCCLRHYDTMQSGWPCTCCVAQSFLRFIAVPLPPHPKY